MSNPKVAYKVLTSEQMAALCQNQFKGAPVDMEDGYIHLSTAGQLGETIAKYFSGLDGVWIAAVDLGTLADSVRWEPSRGGALFPHIYGPLNADSVLAACPLRFAQDGSPKLPDLGGSTI